MEMPIDNILPGNGLKIPAAETVHMIITGITLNNISIRQPEIEGDEFSYSLTLSETEKADIKEKIAQSNIASDLDISNMICYGENLKGTVNRDISIKLPAVVYNVLSSENISMRQISDTHSIFVKGTFTLNILIIIRGKDEKKTAAGYTIKNIYIDNNSIELSSKFSRSM